MKGSSFYYSLLSLFFLILSNCSEDDGAEDQMDATQVCCVEYTSIFIYDGEGFSDSKNGVKSNRDCEVEEEDAYWTYESEIYQSFEEAADAYVAGGAVELFFIQVKCP